MNINFKIKGTDISDATRAYAQEKAQTLVKFMGVDSNTARMDIEFSDDPKHVSGEVYRVDMVAIAPGLDMHTVGHGETMNAAIDMARDDMARRLSRSKDKHRSLLRKGSRAIKKMLRMSS